MSASLPARVTVVEVGPRDGLQNISQPVDVATKARFVDALSDAGLSVIEVGAFVSARAVPQMKDTAEVFARIRKKEGVRYVYRPVRPRKRAGRSAFNRVLDTFFDGSLEKALATHLADPKSELDEQQVQRLTKLIQEAREKGD